LGTPISQKLFAVKPFKVRKLTSLEEEWKGYENSVVCIEDDIDLISYLKNPPRFIDVNSLEPYNQSSVKDDSAIIRPYTDFRGSILDQDRIDELLGTTNGN
jgi:hypothetical protein